MFPIRYFLILSMLIPAALAGQTTLLSTEASTLAPVKITFQTNPSGLYLIIDGTSRPTPYNTNWAGGSQHTVDVASPQSGTSGTRYLFTTWSDGGGQSHTLTTPATATTYTATFATEYYLSMIASPAGGGTVTPSSGWVRKGQTVSIDATAASGYSFASWSGSGTGSYTGNTRATSIIMVGPIGQTANFNVVKPILSVTPASRPVPSTYGTTTFTVTNAGVGTMNWTAVSDQSWATIADGASGTNNGTITVNYALNPSNTTSRVATITVTAVETMGSPQEVTITQAPSTAPSLIVDTTSLSDDFNGSSLDPGLWTYINPLGDVALTVANNVLTFAVPAGTEHQPWTTTGNTAPRVMQNVDPSMNVNGWTVRYNTLPAGSTTNLPMEGILFEQDSANYVRVDIFSNGTNIYGFAAGFTGGSPDAQIYINVPINVPSPPVWLCVTREGTFWKFYCSLDGQTVFTVGAFDRLLTLHRVGVYAGNAGSAPEAFNCRVDYFQGALPAKPSLSSPPGGEADVPRPILFVWGPAAASSSYRLQVAADSSFATTVVDSQVTETSCSVTTLDQVGQYWWRVAAKNSVGWGPYSDKRSFAISTTSVKSPEALPERFALEQNYPNPFNPLTIIHYSVTGARIQGPGSREEGHGASGIGDGVVRLIVYDLLGREVAVLVNERKTAGNYETSFDGSGLSSGVYVYRLMSGSFVQSRTMILLK